MMGSKSVSIPNLFAKLMFKITHQMQIMQKNVIFFKFTHLGQAESSNVILFVWATYWRYLCQNTFFWILKIVSFQTNS